MKLTAWVLLLTMAAGCKSHRDMAKQAAPQTDSATVLNVQGAKLNKKDFLQQVTDNAQHVRFITAKMKFTIEDGNREMSLTGNLKMKRDDVIRLQLMAFGFVEAGRIEFTREYVLIIDRINKQFMRVSYEQLAFLRNSDIDFFMLQGLFWNELFQPGKEEVADRNLDRYKAEVGVDNDIVVSMERDNLSYRWLTDRSTAKIMMSNVLYFNKLRGAFQLNWDYEDFKPLNRKYFPTTHKVSFKTPEKEVKLNMQLQKISHDEDWETRTELSGKYRQMPIESILDRFMSL